VKHPVAPSVSPSSPNATSSARIHPRTPLAVVFSLALASVSVLAGCPGTLEGNFPPVGGSGSGGSSSGSGGGTGSGGSGMGSGGSGSGGSGSGGSSMGCDAPTMIFTPKCASSSCHGGLFPPDLRGSTPEKMLIGKPGNECGGNLIETTKPASGELFKKIMDSTCGSTQMPLLADPLTSDEIKCVTDWANSKL
jgi:hypothetical protein